MSLKHNPNIIKYLDQVCAQIKCKEIHAPIKNEMVTHIEERIDEHVDNGMDTDEAINKAISQMGDPVAVGIQLHHTHKPKADWRLIFLAAMFLGLRLNKHPCKW